MHWVPLVASLVAAAAITPATVRALPTRPNYRGAEVAFPAGIAILASAFVGLIVTAPLFSLVNEDVFRYGSGIGVYVVGVAFLGLLDDAFGSRVDDPRGWRGHGQALLRGQISTGVLKAAGALGLALLAMAEPRADATRYFLMVAVLLLATNLFNLLDLRPGRAIKAFVIVAGGLIIGARSLDVFHGLSAYIGPILFLLPFDLREQAMLGDTGANTIGAVAGLWIVYTLHTNLGLAVAAGVLALITLYGEFRSISAFVERTPGFRQLDLLGRSHA